MNKKMFYRGPYFRFYYIFVYYFIKIKIMCYYVPLIYYEKNLIYIILKLI